MFFDITIMDIIDVVLVALLLYYFYRVMKESGSLNVFLGILVFIFSWVFVSKLLQMRLLGSIFDQLMSVGTLALVIIFHDEIRNFFRNLGSHRQLRFLSRFFSRKNDEAEKPDIMPIVLACNNMAQQKVGALIVVKRNDSLDDIITTGEKINADISQRLIEAVFFKNAPLHDGAMVVKDGRIVAAQCILPVSHNLNIPKKLGLRHRSAIGITENCDAIAIVVSEETGAISAAVNGKLMQNLDARKLEQILTKDDN
ncbi:MAG: diadenylate cyclase CdaA [Bacteroidaceae bacterium]|nr:diadenylate cyclase CdaA [Bacteroidaceae bacterium]